MNAILGQLVHDGTLARATVYLLVALLLEVMSGVSSAIKHGSFQWEMVSDVLYTNGSKVVAAMVLFVASASTGNYMTASLTLAGTLIVLSLSLLPSIVSNVAELLGQQGSVEFKDLLTQLFDLLAQATAPKNVAIPATETPTPAVNETPNAPSAIPPAAA